jgi:transposase
MRVLYDRVAAIDVHKDMVKVAIRVPGAKRGTRKTDVLEFRTFYGVLQAMARELRGRGVTHVVMEASGVYTDPVYYALRELDFTEVMVINPAHAKALKGHKTDAKDAIRLLDLYECGLLSGSYIPDPDLREVRDLARYRMKTVQARTSEIQRLQKALETAGIKLSSVVSDVTGGSATAMIEALISGERRGSVMAGLAQTRLRTAGKMADLSMALAGRFTDHHALMCRLHLDRIKIFGDAVDDLDAKIAPLVARYAREAELLTTLPGFGNVIVAGWLAGRDRPGPAPALRHRQPARLLGDHLPGELHEREEEQGRADRRRRRLHQAAAHPGRLGRGPGTRPAAGQVPPAGPQVRRPEEQGRAEAGDHRDRPHPAQDRLQRPEDRQAVRRPGRRLLHPPRIPRCQAGLPDAAAPETQPRLCHHHHPRGGRLTAETT